MAADPLVQKSPEPSDELLLEQMRNGDMPAFNTLFKRHSRRAVELAISIVNDHFTAEEIVSDVFFSFWVRRQELPPIPLFQPYLFTAIRYRARTILSTNKGGSRTVSLEDYTTQVQDSPVDPFTHLQTAELENILHSAIEQLPTQRKLIFKLSRINGLSYKTIADILNISESTVKNQLATALKTLRNDLSAYPLSTPILLWLSLSFYQ